MADSENSSNVSRKMSDGMFLSACREVAKDFPDITYDEDLLDRVCLQVCWRVSSSFVITNAHRRKDYTESETLQ